MVSKNKDNKKAFHCNGRQEETIELEPTNNSNYNVEMQVYQGLEA